MGTIAEGMRLENFISILRALEVCQGAVKAMNSRLAHCTWV